MAIKTTLAYGKSFHFYQESLNNDYIYLELEDIPYDVGYRRIMIAIPIDIWETIRNLGAARLDLLNTTDAELIELVVKGVDERSAQYEAARTANPDQADLIRLDNATVFGLADDEREQQINRGFEYYRIERERQRGIVTRIAQHKIIDINTQDNHTSE